MRPHWVQILELVRDAEELEAEEDVGPDPVVSAVPDRLDLEGEVLGDAKGLLNQRQTLVSPHDRFGPPAPAPAR